MNLLRMVESKGNKILIYNGKINPSCEFFFLNKMKENIDKGISEGLSKAKYSAGITCPFCKEDDFDLKGLKYHLLKYCKEYEELRDL